MHEKPQKRPFVRNVLKTHEERFEELRSLYGLVREVQLEQAETLGQHKGILQDFLGLGKGQQDQLGHLLKVIEAHQQFFRVQTFWQRLVWLLTGRVPALPLSTRPPMYPFEAGPSQG